MAEETRSLVELLHRRSKESPDRAALTFIEDDGRESVLDWRTLFEQALGACAAVPVGAGARVAVLAADPRQQVLGFLGTILRGGVPTLLSFPSIKQSPSKFLKSLVPILRAFSPASVLVEPAFFNDARAWWSQHDMPGELHALSPARAVEPDPDPTPRERLFAQFSSGTTGARKGLFVSDRMLLTHQASWARAIGLTADDVIASWLPLYHDLGLVGAFLAPLVAGAHSVHMSPFVWLRRPELLFEIIERHRATITLMPNFAFAFLAERVPSDTLRADALSSLRTAISTGEVARQRSIDRFVAAFAAKGLRSDAIRVSYGMAETVLGVAMQPAGAPPRVDRVDQVAFRERSRAETATAEVASTTFVSSGLLLDAIEARIAGAKAERDVGEIELRGAYLFSGYMAGDAVMSPDGWYRTGDLGYFAHGELFVTGRARDMIIVRGANIHPSDVEEQVESIAGIKAGRVSAIGVSDEGGGTERLVVMAETDQPPQAWPRMTAETRERVLDALAVTLDEVVFWPPGSLQKSTSGKMSRGKNRELYEQTKRTTGTAELGLRHARDRFEGEVIAAWEEQLGKRPLGIDHRPSVDLGADSIATVAVAEHLTRVVGVTVAPEELLGAETIEGQAELLRRRDDGGRRAIVYLRRGSRRSVILFHPGGGSAFAYVPLARRLRDRTVVALQDPHNFRDAGGFASIDAMAEAYYAEIEPLLRASPCVLGGWSMGGVVAFEVARKAVARAGYAPPLLLFEPPPVDGPLTRFARRAAWKAQKVVVRAARVAPFVVHHAFPSVMRRSPSFRFRALGFVFGSRARGLDIAQMMFPGLMTKDELARANDDEILERVYDLVRREKPRDIMPGASARQTLRRAEVFAHQLDLLRAYKPSGTYPGRAMYFAVDGNHMHAHWPRWFEQPLPVKSYPVPDGPEEPAHNCMLDEENVEIFVADVETQLKAWDSV